MRASRAAVLILLAACLGLGTLALSCAGALPPVTPSLVARATSRWPDTGAAELHHGRRLYVDHCAGCHSLVMPQARTPEAWPNVIKQMTVRARLRPEQERLVLRYLESASEEARAPKP
jgi:mono/diheme cytochrome c family protein